MKLKLTIVVLIAAISLFLFKSYSSFEPVGFYKFYEGHHISDSIFFEENGHSYDNDTIYFGDKPVATLISWHKRVDGEQFIRIQKLNSEEKATYILKD